MRSLNTILGCITITSLLLASGASAQDAGRHFAFDPVALHDGKQVAGQDAFTAEYQQCRYSFVSEENKQRFLQKPSIFAAQMDGACARMGPLATFASPENWLLHDGRLYFFRAPSCRGTFMQCPEKFLLEQSEFPDATPEAIEQAKTLLQKATEAAGGMDRIRAAQAWSIRVHDNVRSRGEERTRERIWHYAPPTRFRKDEVWEDWRGTLLLNGDQGHINTNYERPMYADARQRMRRLAARHPLSVLRAQFQPGFKAALVGDGEAARTKIKLVQVAFDEVSQTVGIDPETGRSLLLSYRDRGLDYAFSQIRVTYSDFREVDGLTLPFRQEVTYSGKPWKVASFTAVDVTINPDGLESMFDVAALRNGRAGID